MPEFTFTTKDIVTLVGGAPIRTRDLFDCTEITEFTFAADGGAEHLAEVNVMPNGVIGDFDSMKEATRLSIPADRLHHVSEQNTTDFEKCISRITAPLILGVGFTTGRLDHTLTVFSTLMGFPSQQCLLVNDEEIVFLAPPVLDLDLPLGMRFSIFPMGHATGRSTGLEWPIDGLNLSPGGRTGVSNQTSGAVHLEMDHPNALVMLPREMLDVAIAGLMESDARWPAHGK
ncbi:thiamine diphosphokinase [Cochlodiniinecator piscidefendens]|uniref:thiamine diphosphokinase n=1 Tax=Cochlodiniinecator piscidefendens TaxID=2715756 RepID=UPI001407E2BF|nr:thiamine diphosphokinase [Cochlodiniinecator piscidefendens]